MKPSQKYTKYLGNLPKYTKSLEEELETLKNTIIQAAVEPCRYMKKDTENPKKQRGEAKM